MSGRRAGASENDASWWRDDAPHQDDYDRDAPYRDDAPRRPYREDALPGPRRGAAQEQPPVPRQGGRAEMRRAQQGRGGDDQPGGRADARRARKKPRNKKKIVVWVAVTTLGLVTAAGGAVYLKLSGNIKSFDGDALSKDRPAAAAPDANGHTPVNILLIGSDSRSGDNKDLGGGQDGGARSDTTILLHVYADHKHAVGVSFPRDALVDIPKCKLPNGSWTKPQTGVMFNSAFSVGNTDEGNPACTQNTVEALTNIRVDHTMVVNFEGFAAMTSAVGGVNVCLPNAIYEKDLNPNLAKKGKLLYPKGQQKVEGQAALDYVRLRHGIGDGSDIGRMKRQQAFLSSLITSIKTNGMSPTNLLPLADAATKSMTVDPGLNSPTKLISFGMGLKDIDLHNIKFLTTPWKFAGERVALLHPDVDQLWQALKADRTLDGQDASASAGASAAPSGDASASAAATPAAVSGTGIKVGVYNGTVTAGLGTKAAAALTASDFTVTAKTNASSQDHATTLVQYGPGQKADAEQVAKLFPGSTLQSSTKAGISLVLGKDYAAGAVGAASAVPSGPLPTSVAAGARSADDDPCSNVSYG